MPVHLETDHYDLISSFPPAFRVALVILTLATGYYFPVSRHDDVAYAFQHDQPESIEGVGACLRDSGEHDHVYASCEYNLYLPGGEDECTPGWRR